MARQESTYRFLADSERLKKARQPKAGIRTSKNPDVTRSAAPGPVPMIQPDSTALVVDPRSVQRTPNSSNSADKMDLGLQTFSQLQTVRHIAGSYKADGNQSAYPHPVGISRPGSSQRLEEFQQLHERIKALVEEKESIERAQSDQQMQLEKQRLEWVKERTLLTGGGSTTAADKIVHLSRKNRELTSEIARERGQCAKLRSELDDMKKSHEAARKSMETRKVPLSEQEAERAKLQGELSSVTGKMTDFRNQCQQLKQEIRLMNKLLVRELGDGVDIAKLLSQDKTQGGWRGRQQQVTSLQAKVCELQQALKNARTVQPASDGDTSQTSLVAAPSAAFADRRQVEQLRRLNKRKEKSALETDAELSRLKAANQDLQQRYDASRARCKTLTGQLQTLKGQLERMGAESRRMDSVNSIPPTTHAYGSSPRSSEEQDSEEGRLQQLCIQQAKDIHQLQCQVLKLQQQAGATPRDDSTTNEMFAVNSARKSRRVVPSAARRHNSQETRHSSQSTVSLPALASGSGGITTQNGLASRCQSVEHDQRLSASSSKLVTLKSAGNSAIGTARAASSSAREALRLERDHLRRLTAELLELNNSLTSLQQPSARQEDAVTASSNDDVMTTKLQCENKKLREALRESHRCKVLAFQEFRQAVDRISESRLRSAT